MRDLGTSPFSRSCVLSVELRLGLGVQGCCVGRPGFEGQELGSGQDQRWDRSTSVLGPGALRGQAAPRCSLGSVWCLTSCGSVCFSPRGASCGRSGEGVGVGSASAASSARAVTALAGLWSRYVSSSGQAAGPGVLTPVAVREHSGTGGAECCWALVYGCSLGRHQKPPCSVAASPLGSPPSQPAFCPRTPPSTRGHTSSGPWGLRQ